jgi:hypothetical protein
LNHDDSSQVFLQKNAGRTTNPPRILTATPLENIYSAAQTDFTSV